MKYKDTILWAIVYFFLTPADEEFCMKWKITLDILTFSSYNKGTVSSADKSFSVEVILS